MEIKRFFCADCGEKFNSSFTKIEKPYGRITYLSDVDACPFCGSRALYPDDEEGHADEVAAALDYMDRQFLTDLEIEEDGENFNN